MKFLYQMARFAACCIALFAVMFTLAALSHPAEYGQMLLNTAAARQP